VRNHSKSAKVFPHAPAIEENELRRKYAAATLRLPHSPRNAFTPTQLMQI